MDATGLSADGCAVVVSPFRGDTDVVSPFRGDTDVVSPFRGGANAAAAATMRDKRTSVRVRIIRASWMDCPAFYASAR
jgi:hypothetical protein